MTFYLRVTIFKKVNLDNLAKPVLDTIFRPYDIQVKDETLTGALFELDNSLVNKLRLEKRQVATYQDEGIDILVCWEE